MAEAEIMVLTKRSCSGEKHKRRKKKSLFKKKKNEDVCFVCFDGGNLVLCDRKDCPKAYHPVCTGREESFFKMTKNWNCGWHICSICDKAAHHMCYTCPYSCCKGCIKEAELICVRRNKGFCKSCMETVTCIEKNEQANGDTAQVDINDRNSCQFLFREYWIDLKRKHLFKLDELIHARNTFMGSTALVCEEEPADRLDDANGDHVSNPGSSSKHLEVSSSIRTKVRRCSNSLTKEGSPSDAKAGDDVRMSILCDTDWACGELLNFLAYMRNGDTSVLSHFSVQALLLEYITRNNLRDPHQKSQILCDSRLESLFGKACIGHFEMLRYLRSHFMKKDTQVVNIQARLFDTKRSQMETDEPLEKVVANKIGKMSKRNDHISPEINGDDYAVIVVHSETNGHSETSGKASADTRLEIPKMGEHRSQTNLEYASVDIELMTEGNVKPLKKPCVYKRLKLRKRGVHTSVQLQTNLGDYAAIDAHNINLLYLRRNLLEDLLEDIDKFHDRVVGSFVRIRIDSSQKQEMHRLVRVVGTGGAPQPYKTGEKMTNFTLEILNLGKTEIIPIFSVSNDEFSEDELRESIKYGMVSRMTVGQVQEKAIALQEVRVNDWLKREKTRLCNLRDWASEKGRRKDHRECIEKLQLLSTPEECLRRVQEIPEIHADPNMGPSDESQIDAEPDDKRQGPLVVA